MAFGGEPGAVRGRLRGFRRHWGAAMDNWEGGEEAKHYLDRASGERPRIRVAYLDLREEAGSAASGLALPVDADRLAALDQREINYERIEVTDAFEPAGRGDLAASPAATRSAAAPSAPRPAARRVFAYLGTAAAHQRCRRALADGDGRVSRDYLAGVTSAFAALGGDALAEFENTTDPSPFPLADLRVVNPPGPQVP